MPNELCSGKVLSRKDGLQRCRVRLDGFALELHLRHLHTINSMAMVWQQWQQRWRRQQQQQCRMCAALIRRTDMAIDSIQIEFTVSICPFPFHHFSIGCNLNGSYAATEHALWPSLPFNRNPSRSTYYWIPRGNVHALPQSICVRILYIGALCTCMGVCVCLHVFDRCPTCDLFGALISW